jgi:orotate phosphoribosyltransferase-like protein
MKYLNYVPQLIFHDTSMEVIELLREMDAKPIVVAVLMDIKVADTFANVPI